MRAKPADSETQLLLSKLLTPSLTQTEAQCPQSHLSHATTCQDSERPPQARETLVQWLNDALETLTEHERQDDFSAEDRLLRLLPFLQTVWRADDRLSDHEAGYVASLPYVPPSYREGDPFYDPALDD